MNLRKNDLLIRSAGDRSYRLAMKKIHVIIGLTNLLILFMLVFGLTVLYNSTNNQTSQAQSVPTIRPGAEGNDAYLPFRPPSSGRIIAANANASDIESKANSAQPGDIIEVADGTYSGNVTINSNGTADRPIVIRAKNRHGTTATNCGTSAYESGGCFRFNASHIVVQQFRITTNSAMVIMMGGFNNVFFDNYIVDSGNGQTGAIFAIVHLFGATPRANGGGSVVQRKNLVLKNEIVRPRNTPFYNHEGSGGNIISHNIIRGPHGIQNPLQVESEAFKNGCCGSTELQNHFTRIQFNSIYEYGPANPYLFSLKFGDVTVAYNKIINYSDTRSDGAHMETRASRIAMVGNLLIGRDAGIFLSNGNGQVVKYNKMYATGMRFGKGAFQITGTGCYGVGSCYNMGVGEITDNVIYNSEAFLVDDAAGNDSQRPSGSTFRNNVFLRSNNGPWVDSGAFPESRHIWRDNTFFCISGCSTSQIQPGISLTNGNRAGTPTVAYSLTDPNQSVFFDPQYIAPPASGLSPAPAPSPSPAPSPTPAPPAPAPAPSPSPAPSPTPAPPAPAPTGIVIEAETAVLLGNPATKASHQNVGQFGAGHVGFSGQGYVYNWQPAQPGSGIRISNNVGTAGTYEMIIRYTASAADIPKKNIRVGGVLVATDVSFPKSSNWDSWIEKKVSIVLARGTNSIEITSASNHPQNGWMNVDRLSFALLSASAQPSSPSSPLPNPSQPTLSNQSANSTNRPPAVVAQTKNGKNVVIAENSSSEPLKIEGGVAVALNRNRFAANSEKKVTSVMYEINGEPAPTTNGSEPDTALDTTRLSPGVYTVVEKIQYDDGTSDVESAIVEIPASSARRRISVILLITFILCSITVITFAVLRHRKRLKLINEWYSYYMGDMRR